MDSHSVDVDLVCQRYREARAALFSLECALGAPRTELRSEVFDLRAKLGYIGDMIRGRYLKKDEPL